MRPGSGGDTAASVHNAGREASAVLVDAEAGVLTITLNRPEARNAINWTVRRRLRDVLAAAAADPAVRVVVMRGDERAFCSGGDIKEMGGGRADDLAKLAMAGQIVTSIAGMPQPVVAVVRGHAAGAGFSLALGCDLVVADDTAVFSAPFVRRGLVPDMGASHWLTRHLGPHRAKDILLTGRSLSAAEAADLGIVSRLCRPADLDAEVDRLVAALAESSPTATSLTKRLVNQALDRDLAAALDTEQMAQALAADTDEARGRLPATTPTTYPPQEGPDGI